MDDKNEVTVIPVSSLNELRRLSMCHPEYAKLLFMGSSNLGGPNKDIDKCYNYLYMNASEVSEEGVIEEVNACINLLD